MPSTTQERLLWSKERRIEMIDLWEDSLCYCYSIFEEAEKFPQGASLGVDQHLKDSALAISDHLAKCTNAVDKEEFKAAIDVSVRKLEETVSDLYLANRWKYLSDEKFNRLYQSSRTLMGSLKFFQ